jgi:hypothetical protein
MQVMERVDDYRKIEIENKNNDNYLIKGNNNTFNLSNNSRIVFKLSI